MDEEDRKLFRELMADVKPHRSAGRVSLKRQPEPGQKLAARERALKFAGQTGSLPLTSRNYIHQVDPNGIISFVRGGIQHRVFKDLRLGKLAVEESIDLHGHTVEQAAIELIRFIDACVDAGHRVVMVTHGHGAFRDEPAVLKSCVNHWLRELDAVLAFHSAQPGHGGAGATYVLLRRNKGVDDGA